MENMNSEPFVMIDCSHADFLGLNLKLKAVNSINKLHLQLKISIIRAGDFSLFFGELVNSFSVCLD